FDEINTAFSHLSSAVQQHRQKLNEEGINQVLQAYQQFLDDKQVGERFIGHIFSMLKEEPVIEKNSTLQKRISDAARHFESRLSYWADRVKNHPLVTEYKDVANETDEALRELALAVFTAQYYISYCRQPFELGAYLKHKLAFAQSKFSITSYASGKKQNLTGVENPELFETLKRWRDIVFEETALPVYMIANAETLKSLSAYLPLNKNDLGKIKGFGKARVDRYGDDIIDIIADYCEKHGLETNMQAYVAEGKKEKESRPKKEKTDTKAVSLGLFKQGRAVSEIAKERGLTVQTIEGHLAHYIETGEVSVDDVLAKEKQAKISAAFAQSPEASLTQLKELLPGIGFGELRLMMAALKHTGEKAAEG
ncbi:MAG TPA: helix-turn-helix domain-containing protein, partial [Chitinophagaceae bacterium]|nr:helix-turn-helix domain-containing protein [Chitinophagaceae bacterium]